MGGNGIARSIKFHIPLLIDINQILTQLVDILADKKYSKNFYKFTTFFHHQPCFAKIPNHSRLRVSSNRDHGRG
jgi:hypothetical protein